MHTLRKCMGKFEALRAWLGTEACKRSTVILAILGVRSEEPQEGVQIPFPALSYALPDHRQICLPKSGETLIAVCDGVGLVFHNYS